MYFFRNHTQNVVEKIAPGPFLKNGNWVYLWINSLKFYTVILYYMSKSRTTKICKVLTSLVLPHINLFKKTKIGLELVSLPHFLHGFWKKISRYILLNSPTDQIWCLISFTSWDIGQYVYCNYLCPSRWCHKFLALAFLSSRFPIWPKISWQKI